MSKNRDDFTEKTKVTMAQRVAYKCSNPDCRKLTVGPNTKKEKSTIIGVAAHITAAAAHGPRYDAALSEQERKHINNGIWLCNNCSTIIDKDPDKFPIELLNEWKEAGEKKAWEELVQYTGSKPLGQPKLQMDLIWSGGGKSPRGLNFIETKALRGDKPISPFNAIYNNELFWNFNLSIYNNSSYPAFNIRIAKIEGHQFFTFIDSLPKVNNIPPLSNIDLEAKYNKPFVGTGKEALKLVRGIHIPPDLIGMKFSLKYENEEGKTMEEIIEIDENGLI